MNEKIQIIQYNPSKLNFEHENITNSSFKTPISFDNFDINIIDLSSEDSWKTISLNYDTTIHDQDFNNLKSMLLNSKTSKVIIIYPQNIMFTINSKSVKTKRLQYLTPKMHKIISLIYPHIPFIEFEKNFKKINNKEFSADFYFKKLQNKETLRALYNIYRAIKIFKNRNLNSQIIEIIILE